MADGLAEAAEHVGEVGEVLLRLGLGLGLMLDLLGEPVVHVRGRLGARLGDLVGGAGELLYVLAVLRQEQTHGLGAGIELRAVPGEQVANKLALVLGLVGSACGVLAGIASYRFIEQPFLRIKDRRFRRPQDESATASSGSGS